VPEISGPNNVPGKRPDAELGKIEPTPGGWNQMPAKNKEREACLNPNPQISTPPDRKRPQQAETKRRKPESSQQQLPKLHLGLKKTTS
jgi:hypothetical protein